MKPELHEAWKEVLFWAKRLSYNSAKNHPEWEDRYADAKENLAKVKKRLAEEREGQIQCQREKHGAEP